MEALMTKNDTLQTFIGNGAFHSFENAKEHICFIYLDEDLSWMSVHAFVIKSLLFFEKMDGSVIKLLFSSKDM
ncbi:unnamed protein product [Lupinus luteus]|uniref:Uncharacterized protein n=1 Tax=Lupinus luteus TaxID=3873 RepID=A0AAV1WC04_LUPLU